MRRVRRPVAADGSDRAAAPHGPALRHRRRLHGEAARAPGRFGTETAFRPERMGPRSWLAGKVAGDTADATDAGVWVGNGDGCAGRRCSAEPSDLKRRSGDGSI